ncbi:uncharacterized protein LOC133283827 [Gastrolobium bilobum]|uniref:uncharacterized protein LOC133283827 n=1 Tax=Gastrolobium bilobum TaxID=150636 RepID=UPI002AB0F23D|nr:uncharacterized protein LOC133283827 [Gastrolobium bilobum]
MGQYNNSPFTGEILNPPFPKDFDSVRLPKYDGSQDPQVLIDAFDTNMYIRGINEPLISRIFSITLTGAVQTWFSTLPANSIGSFDKFGQTFKDAALQVLGLQENVHVHFIVAGLDGSSRLAKSVYKDHVRTLEEFRNRSKKYLELEQMEIANALSEEGKRASPRRKSPTPREKDRPGNKKKDSRGRNLDDRDRVGIYEKYTPLNASRSQIWRKVAMTEMKKCWDLRDAVEKFVRERKLRQYVIKTQGSRNNKRKSGNWKRSKSPVPEKKKKEERNQKDDSNNDEFPEAEFDCNVINGALGGEGDTVSSSGRHVDGLVVTGTLVNYRVKKIFIDTRSSADIILWDAFKKLNLDEEDLKPSMEKIHLLKAI